ncbi:MAG: LysM peptidoglycan-binding domain-containing protein [Bacteroidales bacterium]|jgi:LysM repeat protein/ABC-type branched-subunit amino acid transport system substrate-binding protein
MRYLVTIIFSLSLFCSSELFGQFTPAAVVVSKERTVRDGIEFYVHKAEKNQTLFSISKSYGISAITIINDNPVLKSGLKEGETIYIRTSDPKVQKETTKQGYKKHIVRWYETIESIAKKYNVSVEDIINANSLNDRILKTRQKLLIPVEADMAIQDENIIVEPVTKTATESVNEIRKMADTETENVVPARSERKQTYDVSLILPIGSNNTEAPQDGNNNYLDFYQGFLLAAQELKAEGMNASIKVFDLSDFQSGSILAQSGRLDGSDIIIGPVFMNEVEPILNYASERSIPLVSPMDPKTEALAKNHPDFFQASSSPYSQQLALLRNLTPRNYVTIIFESSDSDKELVDMTKEILNNKHIQYNSLSYNLLSGRSVGPLMAEKLSLENMNDVIVVSNSEAFVSDVLRNLNLLNTRSNYQITLYGTHRWRSFESIDINYFHSMNLHISLQYYVDYSDENVKKFLARYRALYGSEPTPYSFQAYDIAYYFLGALNTLGTNFSRKIDRYRRNLLQTDMIFERIGSNNGFINNASRLIIYNPDYSINISHLSR